MNNEQIKKIFSERLVKIMKENGMIQQDIVDKFEEKKITISRGMVSNWCSGRFLPTFENAIYLTDILHCSPNDLLKF